MKNMNGYIVLTLISMAMLIQAQPAYAAANPIGTGLCTAARWFTSGTVGFGLVALGFIIFAIAMLLNKMTWPIVIIGFLDTVAIFGADWFVTTFGGTACPP